MKGQIIVVTNTVTLMRFQLDLQAIQRKKIYAGIDHDVQVNPDFKFNLVSLTKLLKDGFHLFGDINKLYLFNKKRRIDAKISRLLWIQFHTWSIYVSCLQFQSHSNWSKKTAKKVGIWFYMSFFDPISLLYPNIHTAPHMM